MHSKQHQQPQQQAVSILIYDLCVSSAAPQGSRLMGSETRVVEPFPQAQVQSAVVGHPSRTDFPVAAQVLAARRTRASVLPLCCEPELVPSPKLPAADALPPLLESVFAYPVFYCCTWKLPAETWTHLTASISHLCQAFFLLRVFLSLDFLHGHFCHVKRYKVAC
eukprot:TRINITY_DN5505_c0_g1_i1.p1 TRINITY_DN5505_c0_g1~~TRINITY_DN5505_c0_g1_i1.p1  ORF type:complete len:165 (+),score=12.37 TRINITY_DN5505_c0_g1_i1:136-630(+)